jgi:putative FmdB family regulatory protein
MPIYTARCTECAALEDYFQTVENRSQVPPSCADCGGKLEKIITKPAVQVDITPFVSPRSGKVINSRSELREDLARTGCRILEPGMKQDIQRNRIAAQEKAIEPILATVDKVVTEFNVAGKLETFNG